MGFILWILAVILAVAGIIQLFQHQLILGIVLLVLAAGIGPGGWSFFRGRSTT
jgi:hypothetical protein